MASRRPQRSVPVSNRSAAVEKDPGRPLPPHLYLRRHLPKASTFLCSEPGMLQRKVEMVASYTKPPPSGDLASSRCTVPSRSAMAEYPGRLLRHHQLCRRLGKASPLLGLGLGMWERNVELVDYSYSQSQPPSGGIIPAGCSPGLPNVGVQDVAHEGTSPLTAGHLHRRNAKLFNFVGLGPMMLQRKVDLPSSYSRPPPSSGITPGSTAGLPNVRVQDVAHDGPSPIVRQLRRSPKLCSFLGSALRVMQLKRKLASPYPQPPSSGIIPAGCLPGLPNVAVQDVANEGGSSPAAGIVNNVPHALQACSLCVPNVKGLRRALPCDLRISTRRMPINFGSSHLGIRRQFSTLPRLDQQEVDLMTAKKTWSAAEPCLFTIQRPSAAEVKAELNLDMDACDGYMDEKVLKETYETVVRPALIARCLLSSYGLSSPEGKQLHSEYFHIISDHPRYMTTLDLMESLNSLPANLWCHFLDHLSEDRAIVIEDWNTRLGVSVGTTIYDHSIMSFSKSSPSDESLVIKGESDASFYTGVQGKGKAKLAAVIWHKNKVLSCTVVDEVDCGNSIEAEAMAMYILLKEGVLLGLHENPFKSCTDCEEVYKVLWGSQKETKVATTRLYRLLKFMRGYYKQLIPRLEPRERMMFVDGIMRVPKRDERKQLFHALTRRLNLDINGHPIFMFKQKSHLTDHLGDKKTRGAALSSKALEYQTSCYLEVEEKKKVDAICHLASAMRPGRMDIIARDMSDSEQEILKDLFEDADIQIQRRNDYVNFTFTLRHRLFTPKIPTKTLRVILGIIPPGEQLQDEEINIHCTVDIHSSRERRCDYAKNP